MRGLGRLIALPWLLAAMALQGLAPAQAAAMPRDAFGAPICSAREPGVAHRPDRNPANDRAHDCCAAACALAGLSGAPPALASFDREAHGARLARATPRRGAAPALAPDRRPNARGPPKHSLTI